LVSLLSLFNIILVLVVVVLVPVIVEVDGARGVVERELMLGRTNEFAALAATKVATTTFIRLDESLMLAMV
jgi:hypothetical protein